jgi:hypothetical protein
LEIVEGDDHWPLSRAPLQPAGDGVEQAELRPARVRLLDGGRSTAAEVGHEPGQVDSILVARRIEDLGLSARGPSRPTNAAEPSEPSLMR